MNILTEIIKKKSFIIYLLLKKKKFKIKTKKNNEIWPTILSNKLYFIKRNEFDFFSKI